MKCVIGMDFGTQSARAVLMDAASGEIILRHEVDYGSAVSVESFILPTVYDSALETLLRGVARKEYREQIAGICVDATSLTLVPLAQDGSHLSSILQFAKHPHAQIKLWKRHTAQPQAEEALNEAKKRREPFLRRTGGSISSEWMLPKLMETMDCDPLVYEQMDRAMDLCEYLTFSLTGFPVRSTGSLSFKCLWARDLGLPPREYLDALRPGLGEKYRHLLRGPVKCPGESVGFLSNQWCEKLNLPSGIAVSAGALDGHTSMIALGALQPGDAVLVAGTSAVFTVQTQELHEIEGICGIALDGQLQGLYGIDAGQSCAGDMLAWYVNHMLPGTYWQEARQRNISAHDLLAEKVRNPWQNTVIALDWWNGSRNAPCNLSLDGMMTGITLKTKPENIYLALLQAIVCGTGEIIDLCQANQVRVDRLLVCGGIAEKNQLLMEQYASLLGRPVEVAKTKDTPAVGSAILAAVAAGIYASAREAHQKIGIKEFTYLQPDEEHGSEYAALRRKNHLTRQMMIELARNIKDFC